MESDEPTKYVSVTALTGLLPKGWMEPYAAKHAAVCAFTEQDKYRDMPEKDERIKYVAGASKRYSMARAARGTEIHEAVEKYNLGQIPRTWPLPVRASMKHYERFMQEFSPRVEAAEVKVYHRGDDLYWDTDNQGLPLYAGTCDMIAEIDGHLSIVDIKTGKSIHEEACLQINAYAYADFLVADPHHPGAKQITPKRGKRWYEWHGPADDEIPMPEITKGYVLHLRDDGYDLHEVPIADEMYEMFLSLFAVERWERELKKRAITGVIPPPVRTDDDVIAEAIAEFSGREEAA